MVEWKAIDRLGGLFCVSNTGLVRNAKTGHVLKYQVTPTGYCHITVKPFGRQQSVGIRIHREVALAFVPNPEPELRLTVNHKDGDKTNNLASNLEWVSSSENLQHAYDNKLKFANRGENASCVTLTEAQAQYALDTDGIIPSTVLAKQFGVHHASIIKIRNGKNWSHLKKSVDAVQ